MLNATPYCFKADSGEDYNTLTAHISTSTLNASFFPRLFTIVVTPKEDEDEAMKEVGKFINDKGLNFHINPIVLHSESRKDLIDGEVTPPCILQAIIYETLDESAKYADIANSLQTRLSVCESNLSKERQDKDQYYKWWQDEESKRRRLEDTIKALRTLLNAVVE